MALIVYAIPFLAAIVSGALLFAFPLQLSLATGDPLMSGLLVLISGITYVLTTAGIAIAKPSEKTSISLAYMGLVLLFCAGFLPAIWMPGWWSAFIFIIFQGVGSALFMVSFQIVVQEVAARYSIAVAFSNFIMSWALGYAVGPFVSGLFTSEAAALWFAAIASLVAIALLILVRRIDLSGTVADPDPLPTMRRDVWFGWSLIFLSGFFIATYRGLFPDFGLQSGFPDATTGTILLVLFLVVTANAFMLRYLYRYFLRRPALFWTGAVAYCIGCLLLIVGTVWSAYLAVIFLGLGIGQGSFFAGTYALSDLRHRSRNIGINESVVGVATIFGPLIAGWTAREVGYGWFFAGSLIMTVVVFGIGYLVRQSAPRS